MFDGFKKYIVVFAVGFIVTYILTPVVRKLAVRFGAVDLPNERRPHKRPTARGGGLAVVLGIYCACIVGLLLPGDTRSGGFDLHWWLIFLPSSLLLLVVGLVDDLYGLGAWKKLAGQATAALLIALSGTHFGTLMGYELPPIVDGLLVVIWIVAVINAYNLIDGLDGLASGLAIISAIGLCGMLVLGNLPGVVLLLVALIGACLAFLRYNFHPATIFLGDTGSMSIGFILGVVSLQTFTKNTFFLSTTIPLLILGVPIYDALLAIWRRSARLWLRGNDPDGPPKRMGIMQPDLDHLHHRLVKAGISTKRVALLLCLGNLALVVFGLLITTFRSHAAGIFLIALLAGAYFVMRHLALIELRDTGTAILGGLRRPTHTKLKALAHPVWDMICMTGAVAISMRLFESTTVNFWHQWFLDLPVWVTPTFSLLAISRTYVTVWSRARMRDVLNLTFTLQLGLLISLGIALLIDPYEQAEKWLMRTLVIGALSHPAMIASRVIYRFVEELVSWSRAQSEPNLNGLPVLLYGAGGRCWIFLRERMLKNIGGRTDGRRIVGLMDDEPALHFQWIYGYQVLGGVKDLPQLIEQQQIGGIIITAVLTPESNKAIRELAVQHGLHLTEWRCDEEEIVTTRSVSALPMQASVD